MTDKIELILAIYGVLNLIVRATPTQADDKILGKIGKILDLLLVKGKGK